MAGQAIEGLFSPRMWRCFPLVINQIVSTEIFSTYVEVFLIQRIDKNAKSYFLHVCGGVSQLFSTAKRSCRFSPRMWRCFCSKGFCRFKTCIFSTYVEVFLQRFSRCLCRLDFLHVCGGVSTLIGGYADETLFSPRMWGCFQVSLSASDANAIFSTYVEVFPNISCYLIKKTLFTRCSVTEGK